MFITHPQHMWNIYKIGKTIKLTPEYTQGGYVLLLEHTKRKQQTNVGNKKYNNSTLELRGNNMG